MILLKREAIQFLSTWIIYFQILSFQTRPTYCGREKGCDWKEHVGTFWVDGNVLRLDRGVDPADTRLLGKTAQTMRFFSRGVEW